MVPFLLRALEKDSELPLKSLKEQFSSLIHQPLIKGHRQDNLGKRIYVIVLDALDECNNSHDIRAVLRLLVRLADTQAPEIRVFATSRPEYPLRVGFQDMESRILMSAILQDIPTSVIAHDIEMFFRSEFGQLATTVRRQKRILLPPDWPGEARIRKLVDMAIPLFIFASTVCKFIKQPTRDPERQLEAIIEQSHSNSKLDATYRPVLHQAFFGRDKEEQDQWAKDFRDVVGTIILLFEPLSASSLTSLLGTGDYDVRLTLDVLHSVLDVPEDDHEPVRLFHLSFHDYLVDQNQCPEAFWIDESATHRQVGSSCINIMSKKLRRDLCNIGKPGILRSEIDGEIIDASIPPELQYACRFWIHHLSTSKTSIRDGDEVHLFLQQHFLHWLEALGTIGSISESVGSIEALSLLIEVMRYSSGITIRSLMIHTS